MLCYDNCYKYLNTLWSNLPISQLVWGSSLIFLQVNGPLKRLCKKWDNNYTPLSFVMLFFERCWCSPYLDWHFIICFSYFNARCLEEVFPFLPLHDHISTVLTLRKAFSVNHRSYSSNDYSCLLSVVECLEFYCAGRTYKIETNCKWSFDTVSRHLFSWISIAFGPWHSPPTEQL